MNRNLVGNTYERRATQAQPTEPLVFCDPSLLSPKKDSKSYGSAVTFNEES